MKKISNKVLVSCLAGEIIAFLCAVVLTAKNNYIWFAVAALGIITVFTFYESICRISIVVTVWNENSQNKDREREEELRMFRTQILEEIGHKTKMLSDRVDCLANSQEKMIESNEKICRDISDSVTKIEETNNNLFVQFKDEFSIGLCTMTESISASSKDMENKIKEFTKKVEENAIELAGKNSELVTRIMKTFEEQNAELSKRNDENISNICSSFAEMIKSFSDEISEYLNKLDRANHEIMHSIESASALQVEISKSNETVLEKVFDIMERIESDNKQTVDDLNVRFTEHSLSMSKQHSADLAGIVTELKKVIELLTIKYRQALDDMSNRQMIQIEEWKAGTAEILSDSNKTIETLMNDVEGKLLQNSDLARKVLDENISSTRNAVSEIVIDTRNLLQKQYEKLEELNSSLSFDTKEYTQQLMEQILDVSGKNISEMKSSCENMLSIIVDRIIAENEEIGTKRTEAFEAYIKELEKTYDSIISGHIKALEDQIINSINLFISENKAALMTNNELAADLINSEKFFVSEIESNNAKLRETIDDAFAEYSKSVEKNIIDIKNALAESIVAGSQNTIENIGLMSERNTDTIESLAGKLKEYSDSLIAKSAIAIANVQADNNEKLQKLCDQVAGYISENERFITYCKELSNSLQSSIKKMIDDRDRFIDDLNSISDNHMEGLDSHMKSRIQNMVEQLQALNIKNATMFSGAMEEYREKFVEANANAIAGVQEDNVSSITDANNKISQLADNLKKFQEDISGTLTVLQSIIETGINEQKEQDENFDSTMNELVDEKLSEYNAKLQEYNEYIEILGEKITDVMNACQSNTAKYDETLRYIVEAQKEANSLNNKDVELLKTFMRR